MANDAVFQVRMNNQMKRDVEELYRGMGTTFAEAVRIFAQQSLLLRRMPFEVVDASRGREGYADSSAPMSVHRRNRLQLVREIGAQDESLSGFAMFAHLADDSKRAAEESAWREAALAKHDSMGGGVAGEAR